MVRCVSVPPQMDIVPETDRAAAGDDPPGGSGETATATTAFAGSDGSAGGGPSAAGRPNLRLPASSVAPTSAAGTFMTYGASSSAPMSHMEYAGHGPVSGPALGFADPATAGMRLGANGGATYSPQEMWR